MAEGVMMTLQEKLKSLGLEEKDIKDVNSLVDGLLESKLTTKDEEIKKLQGDLEKMDGELKPFKAEKRNSHISKLLQDMTDSDKIAAAIKLADITDEDDDEAIKNKVKATIDQNSFLAKKVVNDEGAKASAKEVKQPAKVEIKSKINHDLIEGL